MKFTTLIITVNNFSIIISSLCVCVNYVLKLTSVKVQQLEQKKADRDLFIFSLGHESGFISQAVLMQLGYGSEDQGFEEPLSLSLHADYTSDAAYLLSTIL